MALLDGNAKAHALDQARQALGVIALGRADQALGHHALIVGQGQHDAAIEPLDTQVDPVGVGKCSVDLLEGVDHGAVPGKDMF